MALLLLRGSPRTNAASVNAQSLDAILLEMRACTIHLVAKVDLALDAWKSEPSAIACVPQGKAAPKTSCTQRRTQSEEAQEQHREGTSGAHGFDRPSPCALARAEQLRVSMSSTPVLKSTSAGAPPHPAISSSSSGVLVWERSTMNTVIYLPRFRWLTTEALQVLAMAVCKDAP